MRACVTAITFADPATGYVSASATRQPAAPAHPRGMAMTTHSTLMDHLTTGVLIAGIAFSFYVGHCMQFAVDCF
jgi:hypothetical protein